MGYHIMRIPKERARRRDGSHGTAPWDQSQPKEGDQPVKDDYHTAQPPPLETERDAVASVQHILDSPPGSWTDGSHRFLEDTCGAADVELGAYDQQILLVLASEPPTTVAVIAGL